MHDELHAHHGHHHHDAGPHVHHKGTQRAPISRARILVTRHHRKMVALLGALYLLSGFFYVPADQQAVRIRFGRLLQERVHPGLHYSWPYPIERTIRLKINEAQRLAIGASDLGRTLGMSAPASDYLLTGDQNLVRLQAWIQYYIQDPAAYLFRAERLPPVLEALFYRCMSQSVSSRLVDDVLTTERIAVQAEVQKSLQQECDRLNLGVSISGVALEQVTPPEEVRDAFLEVANSREDRNRIVQEAHGYSSEVLPRARGTAQELRQQSEIYRTELVSRAHGESERFTSLWEEYRQHRDVTAARLFLESMEEILPRIRKVIIDDKGKSQGLDLDIFEVQKK